MLLLLLDDGLLLLLPDIINESRALVDRLVGSFLAFLFSCLNRLASFVLIGFDDDDDDGSNNELECE